jgi:tetratricopeptide (TPR) repeat protein
LHDYRGILCLRQQQLPEARQHFQEAIRHQPMLYQAHAGLLRVYLEQDQVDEATKRFPQLAALHPPALVVADFHTERARRLAGHQKNPEVVSACQAALAACPDHTEALALLGLAYLHLEDYQKAAAALDRYLDLGGPSLADIYRARGQARMQLGRFPDAREDYSRALELATKRGTDALHPKEAQLLNHRGWAGFFSNAFELALRDFEKARRFLPKSSDPWIGGGLCQAMLGRYAEAIADARAALERQVHTPEMMFNVACIFSLAARPVPADEGQRQRMDLESVYRNEAVARIRSALQMVPPGERRRYWETKMRADRALDPIRRSSEFAQLEKEYSAPPPGLPVPPQRISGKTPSSGVRDDQPNAMNLVDALSAPGW